MRSAIIVLALIMFLLTACVYEQQEQSTVLESEAPAESTDIEEESTANGQVEVIKTVPTKPASPEYSPEVQAFLDKAKEAASFYYLLEGRKLNNYGSYEPLEAYEVYYRSGKAKKILVKPVKLSTGEYYNEVYMDEKDETAYGICTRTSIICEGNFNKAYPIPYSEQKLKVTPLVLLKEIPFDAKKTEQRMINNRQATAVEYKSGENNVRMYLDDFYGVPLKKIIYNQKDDREVVLEEISFSKIVINNVRSSEVSLPVDHDIIR